MTGGVDGAAPPDPLAKRPFGTTRLAVPPIAVGCAPLGNMPETFGYPVSEEQAVATLRTALETGLDHLDTAALYGDGESERRVGLALRVLGGAPAGTVIQTKVGRDPATGDFSGESVKRRFERSLDLLGLDHLPVVYLHDPEQTTFAAAMAPGGPVEVLQRFQEQGLIGHLGVAGGPIASQIRYVETDLFAAVITHNRFTLVNRSAAPLLSLAFERGLAVLNAAPYGSGILAKGPNAYPRYAYRQAPARLIEAVQQFADLADRYAVPLAALALRFSLRDPRITSTIVGLSRPERVAQTIALARHPVPAALWDELADLPYDGSDL